MVFNWSIIFSLVHTLPSLEWRRLLLVKTLPIARLLQDVVAQPVVTAGRTDVKNS